MSQPMTLTQWYARRAASAAHPTLTSLPAVRQAGRAAAVASPPAAALPAAALPAAPAPGALASARAGAAWGWAEPAAPPRAEPTGAAVPARTELPMARELLSAMARAAAEAGVSEATVWAEAARLWLAMRHSDDPRPPTPGASAPRPRALESTRERCWSAIDVVLRDLRAPLPLVARSAPAWPARAA
jgi:hypothetical protein